MATVLQHYLVCVCGAPWKASSSCVHGVYERLRIQCAEKSKRIEQLEAWAVSPEMTDKQPASLCTPFKKLWQYIYSIYYMYISLDRHIHIRNKYPHTSHEGWRLAHPTFCEDEEKFFGLAGSFTCRDGVGTFGASERAPFKPEQLGSIINRPYIQGFNGLHICQLVLHPVWDS